VMTIVICPLPNPPPLRRGGDGLGRGRIAVEIVIGH
jgi:hypothetical protein